MTVESVNNAVIDAVRQFGLPYEGPCELAEIRQSGEIYTANFNDTRRSDTSGPLFSIDIDTTEHSTPDAVRDYVAARITRYFAENPN